jgi:hypothetical protein
MPIRVDAYIAGGLVRGVLSMPGHLRDVLETMSSLDLERASWIALGDEAGRSVGDVSIAIDDVLVAVADVDPTVPVHAAWHAISLDVGPYRVEGELPTLPGFDPGRALTRPSGEFVTLRDVRTGMLDDANPVVAIGHHALVNRYGVERVAADLMLGFYFPGAVMEQVEDVADEIGSIPKAPTPA